MERWPLPPRSSNEVNDVADLPNIVLVHGAWADGSCWSGVIRRLQADGYDVTAPQFPHTSLADNVARLRQVLARQQGPTVIAGHSYGGQIITALGRGRSRTSRRSSTSRPSGSTKASRSATCSHRASPPPALAHLDIDEQGFVWLPRDDFVHHFAADLPPEEASVMYAAQQPLAASTLGDVMGVPAWKQVPTWYVVAQNDEAIPPDAERLFAGRMGATTIEVASSHVVMTSHPDEVADLIEQAATA